MAKRQDKNYLDFIPTADPGNTWSVEDGVVTIHMVHRGVFPWIAQNFFSRPRVSHIKLDQYGSFLWQEIDGEKSVGDLAELLSARFGQEAEPLYDRLVKYMQILRNNRFILLTEKK